MKIDLKKPVILTVTLFLLSVVLYTIILFSDLISIELDQLLLLLLPAHLFLFLSLIGAVFCLLIAKNIRIPFITKKIITLITAVCLIMCACTTGYEYIYAYNYYTPKRLMETPPENVREMFPFYYESNLSENKYSVEISHFDGTDMITISNDRFDYVAKYNKSIDPILQFKFYVNTMIGDKFDRFGARLSVKTERKQIGNIKYTLYSFEDDFAIIIHDRNCIYHVYLKNADAYHTTLTEFEKEAVVQYGLLSKAAKEKLFLND